MPILIEISRVTHGRVANKRVTITERRLMDRMSANIMVQRDLKIIDAAIRSRKKALAKHLKISSPNTLSQLNAKKAEIMKVCGIFRKKTKPTKKGFKRVV